MNTTKDTTYTIFMTVVVIITLAFAGTKMFHQVNDRDVINEYGACMIENKDKDVNVHVDSDGNTKTKITYIIETSCGDFEVKNNSKPEGYKSFKVGTEYNIVTRGVRREGFGLYEKVDSAFPTYG